MVQDIVSSALNNMMNAKKARKLSCELKYMSNLLLSVLDIMAEEGYITYKIKEGKTKTIVVELLKFNECHSIKPRFYVGAKDMQRYVKRFLPAKDFGVIILSTNKGLMTHTEAIEKNAGGSLIAYCF